jgi:hypothetical protein
MSHLMIKRPVRVLRDLQIREISSVDRGAGLGVKVVLAKRHDINDETQQFIPTEDGMGNVQALGPYSRVTRTKDRSYLRTPKPKDPEQAEREEDDADEDEQEEAMTAKEQLSKEYAEGVRLWNVYVEDLRKKLNCSTSKAISKALEPGNDFGRRLFKQSKLASAADIAKLGGDGRPKKQPLDGGGRAAYQGAPHGASSNRSATDPHNTVRNGPVSGEANLSRLRADHSRLVADPDSSTSGGPQEILDYMSAVKEGQARGMTNSQASDYARTKIGSAAWAKVKQFRNAPPKLPLNRDGSQYHS